VVVSRGLVEADCEDADSEDAEFGLERAKQNLQEATVLRAHDLCLSMLQATRQFTRTAPKHNDLTALALVRNESHDVV